MFFQMLPSQRQIKTSEMHEVWVCLMKEDGWVDANAWLDWVRLVVMCQLFFFNLRLHCMQVLMNVQLQLVNCLPGKPANGV